MASSGNNAKGETVQTIVIGGVKYEIVRAKEFGHGGRVRTAMFLRRPAGNRIYHAVRYENGAISGVTAA